MAMVAVVGVMIVVSLSYEPIVTVLSEKAIFKYYSLEEIISNLNLILIAIGCFIGIFGSTFSMNKYLDV